MQCYSSLGVYKICQIFFFDDMTLGRKKTTTATDDKDTDNQIITVCEGSAIQKGHPIVFLHLI